MKEMESPCKIAALDLGSNTFLCLIADVHDGAIGSIYADEQEVVRLGQGLKKPNLTLHPDALKRADACLQRFSKLIQLHKPEKVLAMATSAARDASNSHELFEICSKYQIPLEIIPGDREAAITYAGAVSGQKLAGEGVLVIDIGGGSTEFIFGKDKKLVLGKSYDIGVVRLTEKYFSQQPTPSFEVVSAQSEIDSIVKKAKELCPKDFKVDRILAVAGTPTALVAAQIGGFDPSKIEGFQLSQSDLQNWKRRLEAATFEEKIAMGIPSGRADVMLIGVLILLRALEIFEQKNLTVSTRGVRHGIALEAIKALEEVYEK